MKYYTVLHFKREKTKLSSRNGNVAENPSIQFGTNRIICEEDLRGKSMKGFKILEAVTCCFL